MLLLVVAYVSSVLTCNLEDDTKWITIYRHIDLSILIWSIVIIYENNSDETLWWRENVGCKCGNSLTLPLSWPVTSGMMKKVIYPDTHCFDLMKKGKCCLSLRAVADGQDVMGSRYLPHNLSDEKIYLCYILIEVKDWWFYGCYKPPDFSYMKTFIDFLSSIAVKYSIDCWLY